MITNIITCMNCKFMEVWNAYWFSHIEIEFYHSKHNWFYFCLYIFICFISLIFIFDNVFYLWYLWFIETKNLLEPMYINVSNKDLIVILKVNWDSFLLQQEKMWLLSWLQQEHYSLLTPPFRRTGPWYLTLSQGIQATFSTSM